MRTGHGRQDKFRTNEDSTKRERGRGRDRDRNKDASSPFCDSGLISCFPDHSFNVNPRGPHRGEEPAAANERNESVNLLTAIELDGRGWRGVTSTVVGMQC
jgi:hypothetical protein